MKPRIDAPSDAMRFFTPELYLRFNSADDVVADRADQDWEAAICSYQEHLRSLREQMPSQVRKLAEMCLHDGELLAWGETMEPDPHASDQPLPVWSAFSVLSVRREDQLVSLNYVLWDQVRRREAPSDWPFSKLRPHWLYDEVDVAAGKPGRFMHRILFSDGTTAEIPFAIVLIHAVPWQPSRRDDSLSKIA